MSKPLWNSWCSNFESKTRKGISQGGLQGGGLHTQNESRTFKEICMNNSKTGKFFFEIDMQSDVKEIADCIRNMHKQTKQNVFVFNKPKS